MEDKQEDLGRDFSSPIKDIIDMANSDLTSNTVSLNWAMEDIVNYMAIVT